MEAGFPVGYAPAYTPGLYPGANPAFHTGKDKGRSLLSLQGSVHLVYIVVTKLVTERQYAERLNTATCVLYQR